MRIADNLFQGAQPGANSTELFDITAKLGNVPLGGFSNSWKGAVIYKNIFGTDPSNPSISMQAMLTGTGAATKSLTDSTTWPVNLFNNSNTNLKWANGTFSPTLSKQGLVLSSSNVAGLGDSASLATTTNSGAPASSIVVDSARSFKDDWTLSTHLFGGYHHEYGDCIAVGPAANSTVFQAISTRITAVNYGTNTLTVNTPVTFVVGSKVWKAVDYLDGTCGRALRNRGAAQ